MAERKKLSARVMQDFIKNPSGVVKPSRTIEVLIGEIFVASQFRKYFKQAEIDKLATTIANNGFQGDVIVKDLSVTEQAEHGPEYKYLLIVGESRLRAMQQLGRDKIPADIKSINLS